MHQIDEARRLYPRLAVNLHRHSLIAQDLDLNVPKLSDSIALDAHNPGQCHLHTPTDRNYLENLVVKRGNCESVLGL